LLRTEDRQQVLQELQQSALCIALLMLRPRSAVGGFIEDIRTKNANWREAVLETLPSRLADWQAVVSRGYEEQNYWQLISHLLPEDRESLRTDSPRIETLLLVNDFLYQDIDQAQIVNRGHSSELKIFYDQWRMVWQAFNVLQFAPGCSIATLSGLRAGEFSDLLALDLPPYGSDSIPGSIPTQPAAGAAAAGTKPATPRDAEWDDVLELTMLEHADIDWIRQIAPSAPIVGEDLIDQSGVTISTAELLWAAQKIALFIEAETDIPTLPGWVMVSRESDHWQQQLEQAFDRK